MDFIANATSAIFAQGWTPELQKMVGGKQDAAGLLKAVQEEYQKELISVVMTWRCCDRMTSTATIVRQSPRGIYFSRRIFSSKIVRRETIIGWLFVLPALLMYAAFVLVPLLLSIQYSFFRWDGIGPMTWVGLKNYQTVLEDPDLLGTIFNAFRLVVFFSFIPVTLGLVVASVIHRVATGRLGSVSPNRSVSAPGHPARCGWDHLGLAAGTPRLGQPDPQDHRTRRRCPCLARRLRLGSPGSRSDRRLGPAWDSAPSCC